MPGPSGFWTRLQRSLDMPPAGLHTVPKLTCCLSHSIHSSISSNEQKKASCQQPRSRPTRSSAHLVDIFSQFIFIFGHSISCVCRLADSPTFAAVVTFCCDRPQAQTTYQTKKNNMRISIVLLASLLVLQGERAGFSRANIIHGPKMQSQHTRQLLAEISTSISHSGCLVCFAGSWVS